MADWKTSKFGFQERLHLSYVTEKCGRSFDPPKIYGNYKIIELKNPAITTYENDEASIHVEKFSEAAQISDQIQLSYRGQSVDLDLQSDSIEITEKIYEFLRLTTSVQKEAQCFEKDAFFILEMTYVEDMKSFNIDISNSTFQRGDPKVLANGGRILAPLTARDMQIVARNGFNFIIHMIFVLFFKLY